MLFSDVVNSSIFICAGDSLWRLEKRQLNCMFFVINQDRTSDWYPLFLECFCGQIMFSLILINHGDSLWRPEKRQFLFNFFFVQILTDFYSFCRPKKRHFISVCLGFTNYVAMLGFHKLCCHVLEFTNSVFSDKKKG